MKFTPKTKLVLEKLLERTRAGKYKWNAVGYTVRKRHEEWNAVGYTVRKRHEEWELVLSYSEDTATMSFNQRSPLSRCTFNYVAEVGSEEYYNIQEIVDTVLEPIMEILDAILVEEKREAGTLTMWDRFRRWWRKN